MLKVIKTTPGGEVEGGWWRVEGTKPIKWWEALPAGKMIRCEKMTGAVGEFSPE